MGKARLASHMGIIPLVIQLPVIAPEKADRWAWCSWEIQTGSGSWLRQGTAPATAAMSGVNSAENLSVCPSLTLSNKYIFKCLKQMKQNQNKLDIVTVQEKKRVK